MGLSKMTVRLLSVLEVAFSVLLIYKIINHIADPRDFFIFAAVTLLFCMSASRANRESREERSKKIRENAKLKYDQERLNEMRAKNSLIDESQYETHPINVQYYASKIMNGEMTIDELPTTKSDFELKYLEEQRKLEEERKKLEEERRKPEEEQQ